MRFRSLASSASWGFLAAPLLVVVGLAVVYLIMAPHSADHAAQTFRTELFELSGPTVWNNYWFGGHYLPTYSLLSPPLGAWIGFRVMGSLAVVGTVILFTLIVRRQWGERAQAGAIWFAFAATISLFSGRMTFALGVLLAMAAVFAAQRGQRIPSLVLAGSVGLASPVAALFLACLGFAHFLADRTDRRGLELAGISFLVAAAVALLFPGGGDEPYAVPEIGADNLYTCFAFKAPFEHETQATAWAPIIDDERVVHHWILYRTKLPQLQEGPFPCDVTLQVTTEFVAGWAPGGGTLVLPDDVGLELGGPDDWYILQMHYNNTARHPDVRDRSGVAFCTAEEDRPNRAGIVTLGSLGIAIPPGAQDHDVTGICSGLTTALWPELHVLGSSPHMHQLGRGMRSTVHRLDGTTEAITDVPAFDFESQGMSFHDPELIVHPGETITTTCTYDNPNPYPVFFGEGTNDEMCFDFVLAYPVDTLLDRNCGIVL